MKAPAARTRRRVALAIGLLLAAVAGGRLWFDRLGDVLYVPFASAAAPAAAPALAAVLVSGDMGLKVGLGPRIARRLAADGVPVLGVNSLTYFRRHRAPAEMTALLADAIRRQLAATHAARLVLVGQSFGADVVQVGLAALPADLRRRLALVILVVPGATVAFQASPAEVLGLVADDAPALATARRLDWVPTLCIRGLDERHSLCPLLRTPNVRRVALPGGHPLHRDADALYAAIRPALRRTAAAR